MLEQYSLEENDWMSRMYAKKHWWMEAYFKGHFFAGMRTTQRCEDKKTKVVYRLDMLDLQEVDEDGVWDSEKHNKPLISCDCNLFKGKGIPCRHMFYVMKVKHLKKIPESMIFKRWMKSAALDVIIQLQSDDEFSKGIDISRFASLNA
ncbi:hypothetical protein Dsin_015976 [Dipteronia sinensis]|uniref:Protein FAR1-RELATED SEQUENCE n=1 Tax=Dipteronia sinensis TaxID=43782 RepID=A0AAE0ADK2_9ROSI|nr:hypothetical protein Dsin_015976 [Dipteronia sinensis]